jgi:hypothetical protein
LKCQPPDVAVKGGPSADRGRDLDWIGLDWSICLSLLLRNLKFTETWFRRDTEWWRRPRPRHSGAEALPAASWQRNKDAMAHWDKNQYPKMSENNIAITPPLRAEGGGIWYRYAQSILLQIKEKGGGTRM